MRFLLKHKNVMEQLQVLELVKNKFSTYRIANNCKEIAIKVPNKLERGKLSTNQAGVS